MTLPAIDGHALNGLGATAFWTAAARAAESEREDRLIVDPWAGALAGETGMAWLAGRPAGSTLPIVLRTRYFDDYLIGVAAAGMQQFVLLAAGLDTRAYRLPWPQGVVIYELDRAEILDHKQHVVGAAVVQCERRSIAADLTGPWQDKLLAGGFDPARPACWLLEGFLFYLSSTAVTAILDSVATWAASGSRLAFDIINNAMLTSPITRPWLEMQAKAGAPWTGTLDNPGGFLAVRGWTPRLTQAGQPDANHGRWKLPVLPVDMPDIPHNWFVTAEKR